MLFGGKLADPARVVGGDRRMRRAREDVHPHVRGYLDIAAVTRVRVSHRTMPLPVFAGRMAVHDQRVGVRTLEHAIHLSGKRIGHRSEV